MALDKIYSSSKKGVENNDKLFALRIESGLYINDGKDTAVVLGKDVSEGNYELIYLTRLEHFYTAPNTHFNYSLSSYYVEGVTFDYYRDVLEQGKETSPFTFDESFPSLPYRFKESLSRDEKWKHGLMFITPHLVILKLIRSLLKLTLPLVNSFRLT